MQKHNKYLVWTIWVATIAFIGAGFVGWGTYSFGSKAGNVAKVGNIEIKQTQLNMAYSNLYNQYNEMMQGKLDEKKAKEMGLIQQAFSRIEVQAKLLNFAQEMGIVVSDKEVARTLAGIKGFQKDGVFNKDIYNAYLRSQRLKAKTFEATLKDEITIQKTLALLHTDALPLEVETVSSAMNIADKLMYKVLKNDDVNISMDEAKIKAFWEIQKENFMTPRMYKLSIVWTATDGVEVTDEEIKAFYDENSFNYTDAAGKQLLFDEAKEEVTKDLKIKKSKKAAQKQYIAFKKGKLENPESMTLPVNDSTLSKELWDAVIEKNSGEIVKPKVVGDKYATVKIEAVIEPKAKTFEDAKEEVTKLYTLQAQKEALLKLAEKTLETLDKSNAMISDFVTLEKNDNLKSLNSQESLQFLQKLFTSLKEKGIISVADKVVVYKIMDQKFLPADQNRTDFVKQSVNQMKSRTFEANLIKMLDAKYPTEVYMGGLKN
ncbi:peptidylprolyl isomerase [Sulfurovum sp. NBC37-1]|uniref:peptidylprolyl isomerase n=1 Tax=Sulfurovum sp. (strain NBC37-1) TaxID=387093 RepID=UPI001E52C956|nr:peptidylprolyl isomerase [Sulfurovum sp. NBC37-1]